MQTENALEVAGTLTLSELVRFQYFHAFRRSWWMVAFLCLVAGVLFLLAGFLAWFAPGEGFTPSSWMVPLALVLFWGIVITAPYRGAKRLMRTQCHSLRSDDICVPAGWHPAWRSIVFQRSGLRSDMAGAGDEDPVLALSKCALGAGLAKTLL